MATLGANCLLVLTPWETSASLRERFFACTKAGSEKLECVAAQVRAEGWGSDEVEADHLAMLTAPKEGTNVLLPIA